MVTDPIADYLTRMRNAIAAKHRVVEIPASKLKKEITKILFEKGYILNYKFENEGAHNQLFHHVSAHTGVFTYHYLITLAVIGFGFALRKGGGVGSRELDNVYRSERIAGLATDGAADTGNGFDECHVLNN